MAVLQSVREKFLATKPKDCIINFFCYVNDDSAHSACKDFFTTGCGGELNQLFIIDPQEQMKNKEAITCLDVASICSKLTAFIDGELDMVKVD